MRIRAAALSLSIVAGHLPHLRGPPAQNPVQFSYFFFADDVAFFWRPFHEPPGEVLFEYMKFVLSDLFIG